LKTLLIMKAHYSIKKISLISFLALFFFGSVNLVLGQEYIMTDGGSVTACEGTFLDPGGQGTYPGAPMGTIIGMGGNKNYTYTICNPFPGKEIYVNFNSFALWFNSTFVWPLPPCVSTTQDYLYIYNGNSTSAPLIGTYTKTQGPGAQLVGTTGCLTFKLETNNIGNGSPCDESFGAAGWVATISSPPVVAGPLVIPDSIIVGESVTVSTNGDPGGTWASSNSAKAFINANTGALTGLDTGTVNITYTITDCGGDIAIKPVKIVQPLLACSIAGDSTTCKDSTVQLTGSPSGGTWASSDSTVASVDGNGLVTGKGQGAVTISYSGSVCEGIATRTINIESCSSGGGYAGIHDIETVSNISIFPNPTDSRINVEFDLQQASNIHFSIIDLSGRVLQTADFQGHLGANRLQLDMTDYQKGMYSLIIQSPTSTISKKLMKN